MSYQLLAIPNGAPYQNQLLQQKTMIAAVRTKKFILKPAQPEIDPRFKSVKDKIGQKSQQLKKHPPAKLKASEAAKAAKGPPNEKAAGAKAKQVDSMKDTKAEAPPPDSFLVTLRAEIEKVMPSNIEEAGNFMDGGAESQMKGAVGGNVKQQKETASGDLQATSNQPPNEGGVAAKPVESVPSDPAAPVPSVNGGAAMPAAKSEADITQKQTKTDAQTSLKENKLEGKRLENKDSRFAQVKSEKGNVDKTADASPGKFRASEKQILGKSAMQAATQTRGGMTAVVAVKNKSKTAVKSRQDAQKQKDELRRKAVTDRIEGIYTETKLKVDKNLNRLEADVMGFFDPGSSGAIAAFKANTNRDIDKFYDERYSGVGGKLDWIADKFKDTPPRVKEIIQTNLKIFTKSMDNLAVRIAGMVDRRLNQAKADIDGGQAKIKVFVASLPRDLRAVGQEAEKAMDSRFNEMREGVEAKKNDLAQKLAQKYKEAHDQANELAKKIEEENAGAFKKLADAIGAVIKIILEFKDKLMALLRKAADTIDLILDDPIGFLGNLISAIKTGVGQFVGNIWTHIKAGFMKWLFGSLADAGIEIPADLSLVSIFKMVMGVLGLTVPRLKAKAVKLLGPTAVAVIEKLIEYVGALITGGPAKLWEQVKSDIGDLKAMVIDAIQNWVIDTIIKQATIKLLSFFNPAGAFVQAVLAIYNLVMFLIENASKIMAFVEAVIESVSSIAKGAIGAAANWIEQALARMIPLVIGFLARLIGLGGISKKVKEFIEKVQGKVDKAIDKVIGKIVALVKKLFGKLTGRNKDDKRTDNQSQQDLDKAAAEAQQVQNKKGITPEGVKAGLSKIKTKYKLTSAELIKDQNSVFHIELVINPKKVFAKKDYKAKWTMAPGGFDFHDEVIIVAAILTKPQQEIDIHLVSRHGPGVPETALTGRLGDLKETYKKARAEKIKQSEDNKYSIMASGKSNSKTEKLIEDAERKLMELRATQHHTVDAMYEQLRVWHIHKVPERATRFTNTEIMENSIKQALETNAEKIDNNLSNKDGSPKDAGEQTTISAGFEHGLGIGYELDAKNRTVYIGRSLKRVSVTVVVVDAANHRYRVKTAFPTP